MNVAGDEDTVWEDAALLLLPHAATCLPACLPQHDHSVLLQLHEMTQSARSGWCWSTHACLHL
jgi:hypothetical protein